METTEVMPATLEVSDSLRVLFLELHKVDAYHNILGQLQLATLV